MQIIRTKRKTIALVITRQGELVVRAPLKTTRKQIDEVVGLKQAWIEEKQALMLQAVQQNRPIAFREGELLPYLGKMYPLEVVNSAHEPLAWKDEKFKLHRAVLPYA